MECVEEGEGEDEGEGEGGGEVVGGVGWGGVVCCSLFVGVGWLCVVFVLVCVFLVCVSGVLVVCGLPVLFLISPKKTECPPTHAQVRP